jgi:hypothetical protein
LAAQGYKDHGTQLRIAEQRMKQEMPQLFGEQKNGKPPAGVNQPGSRGAAPSNRQKGFADMPKEAQDIARDMVERKVIKSQMITCETILRTSQGRHSHERRP